MMKVMMKRLLYNSLNFVAYISRLYIVGLAFSSVFVKFVLVL